MSKQKQNTRTKADSSPRCAPVTGSVPYDENAIEHNETGETPLYHIGLEDWTESAICERCGGEGFYEYNDGDGSDWGEDSPSEVNHLITCRHCHGTGKLPMSARNPPVGPPRSGGRL